MKKSTSWHQRDILHPLVNFLAGDGHTVPCGDNIQWYINGHSYGDHTPLICRPELITLIFFCQLRMLHFSARKSSLCSVHVLTLLRILQIITAKNDSDWLNSCYTVASGNLVWSNLVVMSHWCPAVAFRSEKTHSGVAEEGWTNISRSSWPVR